MINAIRRRIAFIVAPKERLVFSKSLDIETELDRIAVHLHDLLHQDKFNEDVGDSDIKRLISDNAPWYQRIEFPKYSITTTSKPEWAVYEDGIDNNLGGRLTPSEACVLRPYPKWAFIAPRLPKVESCSVLEVGCNAGFFSFKFAELGASQVTGIDAIPTYIQQAELVRRILKVENVNFLMHDWCIDEIEETFDIVFSSEVICHFIFPFLGLYKLLSVARQFVVLDLTVNYKDSAICYFTLFPEHKLYNTFLFSDVMLTNFFIRCGIPEGAITKYPYASTRVLYVINVKNSSPRARLLLEDDPLQSGKFDTIWLKKQKT